MKYRIIPYEMKFKQAAKTSRGEYRTKKVWYVVLMDDATPSHRGIGECAPLHDLSIDAIPEQEYLHILSSHLDQYTSTGTLDTEALRAYPSILFGIETAILSYQASLRGDYMALYDNQFTRGAVGIPINGLIWMGDFQKMRAQIEDKLSQGFKCIKIKIGAIDWNKEISLIAEIRKYYSRQDIEIRVDANGAFAADEAMSKLKQLAAFDIHSIEQPIRAHQHAEMARLCQSSPLPIALDEELIGNYTKDEKAQLLDEISPQYIILKPSLHGGILGCQEWIDLAKERGIGYWITSALESDIGLNAIANWTSHLLQSDYPPTTKHQGLGTGQLFLNNYQHSPLHIQDECLFWGSTTDRLFSKEVEKFKSEWQSSSPTITLQTSGSTGSPKAMLVPKAGMKKSALRTSDFFRFKEGQTALLCMPLKYVGAKMVAIRAWLQGMHLISISPSLHPFAHLRQPVDFVSLTPLQAYETLQVPRERRLLAGCKNVLLGGGAISPTLEAMLCQLPCAVWSSYGMTETYSHIALRRINGPTATAYYQLLDDVEISTNDSGALIINDTYTGVGPLTTNDVVELIDQKRFIPIGRLDNIVNCGGIKHTLDQLEKQLCEFPHPFFLAKRKDERFGEVIIMIYEAEQKFETIKTFCTERLHKYAVPRDFIRVDKLPLTENGKPQRWQFY